MFISLSKIDLAMVLFDFASIARFSVAVFLQWLLLLQLWFPYWLGAPCQVDNLTPITYVLFVDHQITNYTDFTVHDLLTSIFKERSIYPRLRLRLLGLRA